MIVIVVGMLPFSLLLASAPPQRIGKGESTEFQSNLHKKIGIKTETDKKKIHHIFLEIEICSVN